MPFPDWKDTALGWDVMAERVVDGPLAVAAGSRRTSPASAFAKACGTRRLHPTAHGTRCGGAGRAAPTEAEGIGGTAGAVIELCRREDGAA